MSVNHKIKKVWPYQRKKIEATVFYKLVKQGNYPGGQKFPEWGKFRNLKFSVQK